MSCLSPYIPPPCHKQISIIFADEHVLVVDKPEGLLSVPGLVVKDCVLRRVSDDFPDARVVHRLDLDTSGLMMLSRSRLATSDLNRQFRERLVSKEYIATVYGEPDGDEGEINLPITPDSHHRPHQRIDPVTGKHASTPWQVLRRARDRSRLWLRPRTGRSHQLRIHLACIGHPILGCDLYAHPEAYAMADRLMLHASRLEFAHPATGEPMGFASEPAF